MVQIKAPPCLKIALAVWLALLLCARPAGAAESPAVIAALPFNYAKGPSLYVWTRSAVPAALSDKLRVVPGYLVSDEEAVGAALLGAEMAGPQGGAMDRERARQVAQAAGAQLALWGDVAKVGEDFSLDVYITHVASGLDSVRISSTGPADQLVGQLGELAVALVQQLGVSTEGDLDAQLRTPAARDRYTLVLWGRALNARFGVGEAIDAETARTTLERTLRVDPRLASGWYSLALCQLSAGDERTASASLYEVLRHRPWDARAHRRLAYLALAAGRLPEATSHLADLVELEPEDATAHLDLARALSQQDRHKSALHEAQLAVNASHAPAGVVVDALRLMARLEALDSDLDGMVASFQRLLTLRPGDREALVALCGAALQRGEYDDARELASRLRREDLSDPVAAHMLGEIALAAGEPDEAIVAFHEELATLHAGPQVFRYLARAYAEAGQLGAAAQMAERAAEAAPTESGAWGQLAEIRARLGDHRGAVQALDRALTLRPLSAQLHLNRGIALLELGDGPAAAVSLERALALDDQSASIHYHLSLACLQRADRSAAEEHLRLAIALDPGLNVALYNLAVVLDLQGQASAAARAFEDYLQAAPSDPRAQAIAERIAQLRG